MTLTVKYLDQANPAALYRWCDRCGGQAPLRVVLDLDDRELRIEVDHHELPTAGWALTGQIWQAPIPPLTAAGGNALLGDLCAPAQVLLDSEGWPSQDAETAQEVITGILAEWRDDPTDRVEVWTGADWYDRACRQEPLTPYLSDADLEQMAAAAVGEPAHPGGHVVVHGALEHLTVLRDKLRNASRIRLSEFAVEVAGVKEQLAALERARDVLITEQVGWGDKLRDVGRRAGMSHVWAGKIAAAGGAPAAPAHYPPVEFEPVREGEAEELIDGLMAELGGTSSTGSAGSPAGRTRT